MKKLALVLAMILMCTFAMASCGSESATGSSEFASGTLADGVYTNDSLGLVFTPTANLTMMTQEEIDEAFNVGSEALDVEIDASSITYEMMAADYTTGASVQVIVEKLPSAMTVSEYLAAAKAGVEQAVGTTEFKEGTAELAGSSWSTIEFDMTMQGITYTSTQYVRIMGEKAVTVCFSDFGTGIDSLAACFSAK